MFLVVLSVALACFAAVSGIFVTYFLLVLRSPKRTEYLHAIDEAMTLTLQGGELPMISILVPAYNEESVVERKLRDVAAMQYPRDGREVLLIDDCSTDDTCKIAEQTYRQLDLPGKIIKNSVRMGVNGCYNRGLRESKGDLIATSDADVTVDHDALLKSVKILRSFKDAGGVTARMVPVSSHGTTTGLIETPYRDLYDAMSVAESAVHSTFPGYTNFALIRRSAFPSIPVEYGSSDGNISLAIARLGLRLLYVPDIVFHEPIVDKLDEQARQKTRRAARMIQSAWANKDLVFSRQCGAFGTTILPLRLLMMIVCPLLSLIGGVAMLVAAGYLSIYWSFAILLFLFTLYAGGKAGVSELGLLWSFFIHQCYLLAGLLLSARRRSIWRPVQRNLSHL